MVWCGPVAQMDRATVS